MPPVPAKSAPREGSRNFNCHSYNACITKAAQSGWENFTCAACPLRCNGEALHADAFLVRRTTLMDLS